MNIMIDIETMGNQSYSAIVNIAAVKFDLDTGVIGDTFYVDVDLQSCIDIGLTVNASTVSWWLQQNETAREKIYRAPRLSIQDALNGLSEFINTDDYVWGNSPRFDCGILQNAYHRLNIPIPWNFRNERCVRTLVSFAPEIKARFSFTGAAHDAIVDCINQIGYVCEIWKSLHLPCGLTAETAPIIEPEHEKILKVIGAIRTSFIGADYIYKNGSCFQFVKILQEIFPSVECWYDQDHAIAKIRDKYYDISGEVIPGNHIQLEASQEYLYTLKASIW